jgi:hypothetical protein
MQQLAQPAFEFCGTVTEADPDNPGQVAKFVYQRTTPGAGNLPNDPTRTRQRRRYVLPVNPRTPAQQANRQKHAAAIIAYRLAPELYDTEARQIQRRRKLPYYQAWLSAFLSLNALPVGTNWDGTATTWDAGATAWDNPPATKWDTGATTWDAGLTVFDL